MLESTGDIVVMADTRTAKGMKEVYGGAYHAGCIYAPVDWVKKNPNTVQAVVNAMVRADCGCRRPRPEEVVATVPAEYLRRRSDDLQGRAAEEQGGLFAGRPLLDGRRAERATRCWLRSSPTVQAAKIDLAQTFDNSFAKKALKKYRK